MKRKLPNLVWDGRKKHTPRRFLMRNKISRIITLEEACKIADNISIRIQEEYRKIAELEAEDRGYSSIG